MNYVVVRYYGSDILLEPTTPPRLQMWVFMSVPKYW